MHVHNDAFCPRCRKPRRFEGEHHSPLLCEECKGVLETLQKAIPPTLREAEYLIISIKEAAEPYLPQAVSIRSRLGVAFRRITKEATARDDKRNEALAHMVGELKANGHNCESYQESKSEYGGVTHWCRMCEVLSMLDAPKKEEVPTDTAQENGSAWDLVLKIYSLSYVTRLKMFQELGLTRKNDENLDDKSLNEAYFKRANKMKKTQQMWKWLENHEKENKP